MSVDVEDECDVIEYPITDDVDLNGWDIRKALRPFLRSNPTFAEWIQSGCRVKKPCIAFRARQVMLAAYEKSTPPLRAVWQQDIAKSWQYPKEIPVLDWYLISRRWGVCHELWRQSGCVKAPDAREAEGIARERLTGVARSNK